MTNPARIDRAPTTNHRQPWTSVRLRRRLRSDPHVFLALALAVPTVIVDVLDQGPNELGIAILAFAFLVVQVSLTAVIRTGQPALVPDVLADPDHVSAAAGLRSEICVPLVAAAELLGIVNVELAIAKGAGRNQVVAA